jgi:hypothetical protein
MRQLIRSLLILTSALTTVAMGQEGSGNGPPNSAIIVGTISVPTPARVPTMPPPTRPKMASTAK